MHESAARSDLHVEESQRASNASISCSFTLSTGEHETILADIAKEAPQLKNVLDDLETYRLLRVTLTMTADDPMAYVSDVALLSSPQTEGKNLLRVSPQAAAQMRIRTATNSQWLREISSLENIREDVDIERYTSLGDRDRTMLYRMMARKVDPQDDALLAELREISQSKVSPGSITTALLELINQRASYIELESDRPFECSFDSFTGQVDRIPAYVVNIIEAVKSLKVLYLNENRKPVGEVEARKLLSLKMRRGGSAELQAIQTAVSGLLGVKIDAFESAASNPSTGARLPRPTAEMDVDDFLVQVNGSGIREALRLMLDVQFESPHILLLEEPEVHLHPALEYSVLQYLKSQSLLRQVFLTTHSTSFVDTAETSNVYLIKKNAFTKIERLTTDDIEDDIPQELGLRLSSVFMFDRLVFVEGPSDELALRELAFKLDINLSQHNVGFVQMGGARNFAHYANAAIMDILSKRQVKIYFVIDHDEKTEDELRKITRTCANKADVHVLMRRELENYLLDPDAISATIAHKTSNRTNPNTDEIAQLITESAETLKNKSALKLAIQLGCRSAFFDRTVLQDVKIEDFQAIAEQQFDTMMQQLQEMRAALSKVKEQATDLVERGWDVDALNIPPGADMLDWIFRKFGVRYRKDRDAVTLASSLPTGKVPRELRLLLQSFVA
jgi:putative ATP-dependent endonuclease of the OLD family